MIYYKLHSSPEQTVLAIADKDLIGKTFDYFSITEKFYKGSLLSPPNVQNLINSCTSINIIGEKSITLLKKHIEIPDKSIIKIKGIPHCVIFKI